MARLKLWSLLLIGAVVLIVLVQNSEIVTLRFLFWEGRVSRLVLLPATLIAGAVLGFVVAKFGRRGAS